MKKLWQLLLLGIVVYLAFALVTLPANVLLSRLASSGVRAAGVEGTVWRGSAQVLQINTANLGAVTWDLHALALFTARLKADVKVTRSDGFAQSVVTVSTSNVSFEQLSAALPLGAVPAGAIPGGWTGNMNAKLDRLMLSNGWPVDAQGTLEIIDVTGPARRPVNMGSYQVVFAAASPNPEALTGALTDAGGPLQITGTLQLKPDRSYLIEGLIATRPDAPPDVVNTLQYLGAPDAQGRRPFSLSGTM
jgi:general secretion pathway protein N